MTLLGKIRAIFVTATVIIGGLFYVAFQIQMEHFESRLLDRFMQVAPFCHMQLPGQPPAGDDASHLLTTGGFKPLLLDPITTGDLAHSPPILTHKMPRGTATIFQREGTYILRFHTTMGDQWLRNTQPAPRPLVMLLWYALALAALWGLYLWLVRSLQPLKTLHEAVTRIKHGDLSVSTRQPRRDEIAQVANTLDEALRKIEALIHSRQLFLHAIMHELKTPIAKGKLLNAFLEEGENKERYEALFDRLDLLLGEFAKIEQMLTANYTLRLAEYPAVELADHALELMLLAPEEIDRHLARHIPTEITVRTDFQLFTLALKNLLDNALTHSPDHHATLTVTDTTWTIQNHGNPLPQPLEAWKEPFGASSGGLGLGLYIVHSIAEVLGIGFRYGYEEGVNTFVLEVGKN